MKQLLTKYQFFKKLAQILHIHKNRNFSSIIFATCEPLTRQWLDVFGDTCAHGGYFHQTRTWMCLPDLENLYTNFLPNFPPISIPFSKAEHPI